MSGINRIQRNLFDIAISQPKNERLQKIALQHLEYIAGIKHQIIQQNISLSQLNRNTRVALFNIEGLANFLLNRPHPYSTIYKIFRNVQFGFQKIKNKELLLKATISARLRHSIQLKDGIIHLKISFESVEFPEVYFSALGHILFAKISGQDFSPGSRQLLNSIEQEYFSHQKDGEATRVPEGNEQGTVYDLGKIFEQLNREYFANKLQKPHLRWSQRLNYHRLGSYDEKHGLLVISRLLDRRDIPCFVVEGIVFHEMLHMVHPVYSKNGRRVIHSRTFKEDEKKFNRHLQVERWLKSELPRLLKIGRRPGKVFW